MLSYFAKKLSSTSRHTSFHEICDQYRKMDNPLVIPETAVHSYAAPRLVYCVGHHHCSCFAPFGFEDMGQPFDAIQSVLFGVDISDPLLSKPQEPSEYGWCGKTLHSMMGLLTSRYGTADLQAVISEKVGMEPIDLTRGAEGLSMGKSGNDTMLFENFGFKAVMNLPMVQRKDGVCLVVREHEDTFYMLVNGCMVNLFSADPEKPNCDIISLEEGEFENGRWKAKRRLNGDEAASLLFNRYTLLKLKLFAYS